MVDLNWADSKGLVRIYSLSLRQYTCLGSNPIACSDVENGNSSQDNLDSRRNWLPLSRADNTSEDLTVLENLVVCVKPCYIPGCVDGTKHITKLWCSPASQSSPDLTWNQELLLTLPLVRAHKLGSKLSFAWPHKLLPNFIQVVVYSDLVLASLWLEMRSRLLRVLNLVWSEKLVPNCVQLKCTN